MRCTRAWGGLLSAAAALSLALLLGGRAGAAEFVWVEGEDASSTTFNRHGWYQDSADLRKDLMSPGVPAGAAGDWLGHWVGGDPSDTATATWDITLAEGGTYAWWIRLNPTWVVHAVSVDGAAFQPLDTRDHRELVNVVNGIDVRWLAWVKAAEVDLAPGPHSLTLRVDYDARRDASHGGVDCICLVNAPWEPAGTLPAGREIEPPGPDVWFPLRAGDDPHSPDSITDMSGLLHRPAGIHGPLQRQADGFVFRDRPGERVKFLGTNIGDLLPTEALQRQQARLWAKYGINLVRFHPVESYLGVLERPGGGPRRFDPTLLDAFDRWFSIVKEEGIYVDLSLFYPHIVTPDDGYPANLYDELDPAGAGKSTAGLVNFMRELQDAEWLWLQTLLDHVNPYAGLRYADDPALAIVEVHNEDSVFWHFPLNDLADGTHWPAHTDELQRMWMEWLRSRYADDSELALAWGAGMRPGDSRDNPDMGIYGAWQMEADGPNLGAGVDPDERARMGDFIRFLAETQRAYFERRRGRIRAEGFEGVFVTTAWRAGGPAAQAANLWADDAGDAIDRHAYAGGGVGNWYVSAGEVYTASHLSRPGSMIVGGETYGSGGLDLALYQVEDKPAVLSEWSMSPPNEWKAECAPLVVFYGMGLQGWDAVIHFASSLPRMGSGWPGHARGPGSFVTETPAYLGQFPALAFAIHNGHIQEGDIAAGRRLDLDTIFSGIDALSRDIPTGAFPGEQNVYTPLEVGAIGRVTFRAPDSSSDRVSWDTWWDQGRETVESLTGEHLWDYGDEVVLVRSEKTQAVIGRAGGGIYDLPGLWVTVDTPFVSLIFTPLDDRPLIESGRILVTALARDRQWGTGYSPDGTQLLEVGGPPLLLEPVQAAITFLGEPIESAQVVDIHGVPTGVEVARAGNTITIDGRYQAYYYEVRRRVVPETCLHRTRVTGRDPLAPPRDVLFLGAPTVEGISLDPAAPLAQVPYLCPFQSGDADPDAWGSPLVFYQVTGAGTRIVLEKDASAGLVRFLF